MGKRVTQLGELATVDANDILYGVDIDDLTHSPEGTSKKFKKSDLLKEYVTLEGVQEVSDKEFVDSTIDGYTLLDILTTGWTPARETWTYLTGTTLGISGEKTGKYMKGMKIKLFQTTWKYFEVVNVLYSAPNTILTVHPYDSTTTLVSADIVTPFYSYSKSPVGFPDKPKVWAYLSTTYYNLVNAKSTLLPLDTELYDVGGCFNTETYKFTAPITGYYRVSFSVAFIPSVADKRYFGQIFIDNSVEILADFKQSSVVTHLMSCSDSGLLYLEKGQTVQLNARSDSGDNNADVSAEVPRTTRLIISYEDC